MITRPFRTIPLTKGDCCFVDERDYEWLMQYKWFSTYSYKNKKPKGYAARSVRITVIVEGDCFIMIMRKAILIWMHKEILERWRGKHPPGHHIGDHLNGNSLDNQLENLRWATFQMNARNPFGFASKQLELKLK